MKIELLVKREPFWEILFSTLNSYYQHIDGQKRNFQIRNKKILDIFDKNIFFVNDKLNIIFNPLTDKKNFNQTRKEFSYHQNPLKKVLQTSYVHIATTFPFSVIFANHVLDINPLIPYSDKILILGGNNRLRIIDIRTNTMTVVLKEGFNRFFFDSEVVIRESQMDLDIPKFFSSDLENTFFTEEIISGTPLNRINNPITSQKSLKQAVLNLQKMYEETNEELTLTKYTSQLKDEVDELINSAVFSSVKTKVAQVCNQLLSFEKKRISITLAMTHGDFQDANILSDNNSIWLIDWENAKKRSIHYDALTWVLNARFPNKFYNVFKSFLKEEKNEKYDFFKKLIPLLDSNKKDVMLRIFLVENLIYALQQNNNVRFYSLDDYLVSYLDIVEKITKEMDL